MVKKKQRLIRNLFQNPFSERELMNIILPQEIELFKICIKLSANFLKTENFDDYHRKFLCFRTEQKYKNIKINNKKKKINNNNNFNPNDNNNLINEIIPDEYFENNIINKNNEANNNNNIVKKKLIIIKKIK